MLLKGFKVNIQYLKVKDYYNMVSIPVSDVFWTRDSRTFFGNRPLFLGHRPLFRSKEPPQQF